MKYISDEMRWFEATPIVNKAIIEYTNKRLEDCRKITDNKEKVKTAKEIIKENNKIKLAFNRMLIGWKEVQDDKRRNLQEKMSK